mmetsp:Transcript_21628/g.54873  ORF Transcript_21628/g.54873 Transcript_21628/m.54873 type:complete len:222 (+) Transcript_21628:359-1024(+)
MLAAAPAGSPAHWRSCSSRREGSSTPWKSSEHNSTKSSSQPAWRRVRVQRGAQPRERARSHQLLGGRLGVVVRGGEPQRLEVWREAEEQAQQLGELLLAEGLLPLGPRLPSFESVYEAAEDHLAQLRQRRQLRSGGGSHGVQVRDAAEVQALQRWRHLAELAQQRQQLAARVRRGVEFGLADAQRGEDVRRAAARGAQCVKQGQRARRPLLQSADQRRGDA